MKVSTTIKNNLIKYTFSISSILLILVLWVIITYIYQNELIFPGIEKILNAFINIFKSTSNVTAILFSIVRVLTTVLICFLISGIIVVLYIIYPKSIYFFKPIIIFTRSVPLAVISIFIFILIGAKSGPYLITILMSFPVTIEGLITSVDNINPDIKEELKLLKGSILTKIIKIYIPLITPYILMTFVQTMGMSFKVMIMGEYICQTKNSIGKNLYDIKANIEMDYLIAYGILIVLIVMLLEIITKKLRKVLQQH